MTDKPILPAMASRIDPFKIIIVAIVLVFAFFVWSASRNRIVRPLDNLVTEQLCTTYGEEIEREMLGFERSNRFGLQDRSEGFCRYGEGSNGEAPITLAIEDTAPGPLYRAAKWIGIIAQLGIVSIFLRFTLEPALELYRWVRSKQSNGGQ